MCTPLVFYLMCVGCDGFVFLTSSVIVTHTNYGITEEDWLSKGLITEIVERLCLGDMRGTFTPPQLALAMICFITRTFQI